MRSLPEVQEFVRHTRALNTYSELESALDGAAQALGFQYFALMHHVPDPSAFHAMHVSNYPSAWIEQVIAQQYWADDPVTLACQRSVASFAWSELNELLPLSQRHHEILSNARKAGLVAGFTIPANAPGELSGSVSFAVKDGKSLRHKNLPSAHYVGAFAYEAARRIAKKLSVRAAPLAQLTGRQLDCVVLVARGKSDWEAAQILGISQATVHQHVQAAMKKFEVSTRTQLVVRSLFDCLISFQDVLH